MGRERRDITLGFDPLTFMCSHPLSRGGKWGIHRSRRELEQSREGERDRDETPEHSMTPSCPWGHHCHQERCQTWLGSPWANSSLEHPPGTGLRAEMEAQSHPSEGSQQSRTPKSPSPFPTPRLSLPAVSPQLCPGPCWC